MKGKFALTGTLVLFTILTFSAWLGFFQVQATSLVGVQVGNQFMYKVNSASNAHELDGANNFTITVTSVTGSVVGYQEAVKYLNGSIGSDTGTYNLSNGYNTGTAWLLFDANLGVGDPVYPGWPIWANQSVTIDGRTMGYTVLNNAYVNITTGPKGYLTGDIYGDKVTGAVYNVTLSIADKSTTTSFSYYMTATNVWTAIPEFSPTALIIVMLMLTTTIAAIVYTRAHARLHNSLEQSNEP